MDKEITFEIRQHYGTFGHSQSGWPKEVNLISWNGRDPKIDIRSWSPDKMKSAKIATMTKDEAKRLAEILMKI